MDEPTRKRLEYEEQFYGMSSRFFTDSFKSFISDELNTRINLLVDNFKNKIIDQAEDVDKFELAISEMRERLTEAYKTSLDETFQQSESGISDILSIPSKVLLKEDLPVQSGLNGDINSVRNEVKELEETFQSLLYLKQELLDELDDANSAIIFMEKFIGNDNFNMDMLPVESICELSEANKNVLDNS